MENKAFGGLHSGSSAIAGGEEGQRAQADGASFFQDIGIMAAQAVANDAGDAGTYARRRRPLQRDVDCPIDVKVRGGGEADLKWYGACPRGRKNRRRCAAGSTA